MRSWGNTNNEVGSPWPSPPCTELQLSEGASLTNPRLSEPKTSEAYAQPSDLNSDILVKWSSLRMMMYTWLDTPTIFCNQPQSCPLPMKLLPKHSMLTLLVANSANSGTPDLVVLAKIRGA